MTGIPIRIIGDARDNGVVEVEMFNPRAEGRGGESSMVVYTIPREQPTPKILPFLNETFGSAMNQAVGFSGTPINIHDGTDTALWSGSEITGNSVDFDSTNRAFSGTMSVRANSPDVGDVWQFAKGSDQDLSGKSALTGEININRRWTAGDSVAIYGWDTGAGAIVGNQVFIEDYIDETNFDVWMSMVVPLSDMGLTNQTVDSFRFEQISSAGQTGDFFLDIFDIQESGGGELFKTTHDPDTRYCVNEFVITISDALAGTLADGAGMVPLSYDDILGVSTLGNGILLRSVVNGAVDFSGLFASITDFLSIGFIIENAMSDGTNTSIQLVQRFPDPLIITGAPSQNFLSMTISDDLSGLLKFSALLRGSEVKNL